MENVPILDLGAPTEALAPVLRRGLETFGFVVVEGHGVAPEAVDAAYRATARFFALPEAEK